MAVVFTSQLKSLNNNLVHRYATLWKLRRTDGVTFRVTDHNTDITFRDKVYSAASGFEASATHREGGFNESNQSAKGMVVLADESGITEDDLRAGRYRDAAVTEYLVDWQYPWVNELYKTQYTVSNLGFYDQAWKFELVGQTRMLNLPTGRTFTRNCGHVLGANHHTVYRRGTGDEQLAMYVPRCGYSFDGTTMFLTTVAVGGVASNPRRKFKVDDAIGSSDNWLKYGVAQFLTGNNAGLRYEIAKSLKDDKEITTYLDMSFDVGEGDEVRLFAGCDKTISNCKNKFNNLKNYGGFPDIPGVDRAIFIPDNKNSI